MRKFCFCLVISMILLMGSYSFAQPFRGQTSSEGKSGFNNISVVGISNDGTDANYDTGTPAYIEMTSCAGNVYYLYIGYDGQLRLASEQVVGYLASPATVGWTDASGVVVEDQTVK